jgi:hypothetical protein
MTQEATSNDDPIGGDELFELLHQPSPEVLRVAKAILDALSPDVGAPIGIAALTLALAEATVANTSPPRAWAEVIANRLRELITTHRYAR